MNRRNFLNKGTKAGIGIAAIGMTGFKIQDEIELNAESAALPGDFELEEITIEQLQLMMEKGVSSSEKITQLYLNRIEAIDRNGPKLNSIIELNPDALSIARAMDQERKEGKVRGPMHGIPILIKDNINTADKMMTTAGALALVGNISSTDAFVVLKLREAGAVLLGKTNLSEWANFRSTRSCSGWSSRGGQTKNPCDINRSPCGSSSGSAVAVAANLCAVAVGTETDGSVIAPASMCGITGMKPTVGLISRSGIIPISATQDTAGPMARTVRDLAILLGAMTGPDPEDKVTLASKGKGLKDYTTFLDEKALKGKRIGIEKSFLKGHERVVGLYQSAIEELRKQGAITVEVGLMDLMKDFGEAEFQVLEYEFRDGVDAYLAHANARVKSLKEVIEFNRQNESVAMPYFRQELLEACDAKGGLESPEYVAAIAKTLSSREVIDNLMKQNQLDAIIGVSIGPAGLIDLINGDYDTGFYFCPPAAMAGYPHVTVPMGKVLGLPVGLSFMSGAWKEGELLGMAFAYEKGSGKREKPLW